MVKIISSWLSNCPENAENQRIKGSTGQIQDPGGQATDVDQGCLDGFFGLSSRGVVYGCINPKSMNLCINPKSMNL
jgi:hypothetical protein